MEVASYKTEGNVLHRTRSMCQVGLMNGSLHRNQFLNFHVSFIKALVILLCREPKDVFRSVENGSFSWSHGVSLPGRELGSTKLHCRPAWKSASTSADLKLPTLSFFLQTSHSLGLGLRWSFSAANKEMVGVTFSTGHHRLVCKTSLRSSYRTPHSQSFNWVARYTSSSVRGGVW